MALLAHSSSHEILYAYVSIPSFLDGMFPSADKKEDCHSIFTDNEDIPEFIEYGDSLDNVSGYIKCLISADIPFVACLDYTDEYCETVFCNLNPSCSLESRSFNTVEQLKEVQKEYKKYLDGEQSKHLTQANVSDIESNGVSHFYIDEQYLTHTVNKIKAQFKMLGSDPIALLKARSIT